MNIAIFDTETTSLDKPFCYNIGIVIANVETESILSQKDFVVEQVWHNKMCFASAYYAEKRPLYIKAMRAKETKMEKFGYICQEIIRDFKNFNVECAFAYNSSFDEKVFDFNCDWFKCNNPFDNVPIKDIRGYVHHFIINGDYKNFCEQNQKFTESGNYSTTAETVMQYIANDTNFIEDHTALSDSQIESCILFETLRRGAEIFGNYPIKKSIVREIPKILTIKRGKEKILEIKCNNYRVYKSKNEIIIK